MGYLSPLKSVSGKSSSLSRSQAAVEQTLVGWRVAGDGDFPLLFSGCNIFTLGYITCVLRVVPFTFIFQLQPFSSIMLLLSTVL